MVIGLQDYVRLCASAAETALMGVGQEGSWRCGRSHTRAHLSRQNHNEAAQCFTSSVCHLVLLDVVGIIHLDRADDGGV